MHIHKKWFGIIFFWAIAAVLLCLYINQHSFWTDEWYAFKYFDLSFLEFLKEYWHNPDNHPPGYYLILLAFVKLFGRHDIVVRLPSILGGFGALIMSYHIARLAAGRDERWPYLAVALAAVSPYLIILSQTARYFSLSAFFALALVYAVIKIVTGGGWRWFFAYAATLVMIGYLDYPTFVYVGLGSTLVILWQAILHRDKKLAVRFFAAGALAALPLLPLLHIALPSAGAEAAYGSDVLSGGLLAWFLRFGIYAYAALYGFISFPWDYEITLPLVIIALILLVAAWIDRGKRPSFLREPAMRTVVIMGAVGFFANTLLFSRLPRYTPLAYPRYVSFAFYLLFIAIAAFIWWLTEKRRGARFIILVLIVFVSYWPLFDKFGNTSADPTLFAFNHHGLYSEVQSQAKPGDTIMLNDDFPKVLYDWYHDRYFKNVPAQETPPDKAFVEHGNRLWVIGFGYDDKDGYREPRQKAEDIAAPFGDAVRIIDKGSTVAGLDEKLRAFKKRLTGHDTYKEKAHLFLIVSSLDKE